MDLFLQKTNIWYSNGEIDRKYMRKEWNLVFDALTRVFSAKTNVWNEILTYIKRITQSWVHGYKIDIGKLLMAQFKLVLEKSTSRK